MNIKTPLKTALAPFGVQVDRTITGRNTPVYIFSIEQGFLMVSQSSIKEGYQVNYICTHDKYKRQGHATSLYKLAKNALKGLGIELHHSNSKTSQGAKWVESL